MEVVSCMNERFARVVGDEGPSAEDRVSNASRRCSLNFSACILLLAFHLLCRVLLISRLLLFREMSVGVCQQRLLRQVASYAHRMRSGRSLLCIYILGGVGGICD